MTQSIVEPIAKVVGPSSPEGGKPAPTAANDSGKGVAAVVPETVKATSTAPTDSGETAAAPADEGGPDGPSASTAFHDLTRAYQELAVKNVANLKSAIQALSAVTTPTEFFEVQQRLIKEASRALSPIARISPT